MRADGASWRICCSLRAEESGRPFGARHWDVRVPRCEDGEARE
jgi:hypothetical protein